MQTPYTQGGGGNQAHNPGALSSAFICSLLHFNTLRENWMLLSPKTLTEKKQCHNIRSPVPASQTISVRSCTISDANWPRNRQRPPHLSRKQLLKVYSAVPRPSPPSWELKCSSRPSTEGSKKLRGLKYTAPKLTSQAWLPFGTRSATPLTKQVWITLVWTLSMRIHPGALAHPAVTQTVTGAK
ncbi:hypothetical protein PGIGA_G00049270 [Pangasianodon gigas]|uniref:Uncharacterized protein n=1 Tax=Pangasianodon gigas TaxID=30993 RepID=A0ACC5X234_PANGG|nr:hypothetical protein [Pangasianodon gigas]